MSHLSKKSLRKSPWGMLNEKQWLTEGYLSYFSVNNVIQQYDVCAFVISTRKNYAKICFLFWSIAHKRIIHFFLFMRTFIKHCDACFEDKTKRLFYNILSFNLNKGVKSALFTFYFFFSFHSSHSTLIQRTGYLVHFKILRRSETINASAPKITKKID